MIRIAGVKREAVRTYRNDRGFRTLKIDGWPKPLLVGAFEDDIQTASTAAEVSRMLDGVARGWDETISFSGNSSTVTIYPDRVTIENDILDGEEPFEMSLEQYRLILDVWASYLTESKRTVTTSIPNDDKS